MIKSKKEILEEFLNDAEATVINKEIGIKTLLLMDPKKVIATKLNGEPMIAKERIAIMEEELTAEKIRLKVLKEEYNSLKKDE